MKTLRVASLVFKANLWVAGLSAVVALVAWSLPLLAHRPATSIADVRVGLAGGYALGTTLAVSILLGFGLVSTGLQEGSMAFHMARPLSAWQVWLGRLSAAWALAAGCGLLVWLALTFTRESWVENARVLGGLGILAFGILLLFHAVGTSLRAHSAWMILDLASLGLAALGGLGLAEMMVGRWESQEVTAMATLIVGGGFLVLLLAGWRSIHAGRTSLAGSHRALSITLFMGMLVVHGSSWVYRWRLRTVTATDIPSIAFMGGGPGGSLASCRRLGPVLEFIHAFRAAEHRHRPWLPRAQRSLGPERERAGGRLVGIQISSLRERPQPPEGATRTGRGHRRGHRASSPAAGRVQPETGRPGAERGWVPGGLSRRP